MTMKPILRLLFVCFAVGPAGAPAQARQVMGGGFQVGDRVLLQVEGDSQFTGTFPVRAGPALALPVIGAISLVGVRRSDVEPYLGRQLERYLKNPVVHAKALINISILGEVERPGFYSAPVDVVLGDALMQAGGPTREANVPAIRIERDGNPVMRADSVQAAFTRGLTMDQMGLRDGDRVIVPRMVVRDAEAKWRILGLIVSLPVAIYGVTRLF
jgi:polysaccharide export outer membrane protein